MFWVPPIYTFSPTLINELSWGITRGLQGVNPLSDTSADSATGGVKTYEQSLLPLKDANGNALTLPRINQGSNVLNLLPAVNFGFPSGFQRPVLRPRRERGSHVLPGLAAGRSPAPISCRPSMTKSPGFTVRIPSKPASTSKRMARNVSVYSVYNAAGTYYFGSDRANPLDTGYAYSNALLGSTFAYGDDNKKLVNHARYTQIEWFLQDTWKASRRLTFDYGLRFYRVGDLNSKGATLGLFNAASVQSQPGRTASLPGVLHPDLRHLPDGGQDRRSTRQPGRPSPMSGRARSIPLPIRPTGIPWSGIKQLPDPLL